MAKVNRTKYAILGMLSLEPMSGYDMKKRFDNSVAHFWNENYGHIYPVLKRLENEKLVTKKTETTEGKPTRNIYSITEKGKQDLSEWLLLPAERPTLRIELLLKLFFGHSVPTDNLIKKVENEKQLCEKSLETFDQIDQHVKAMKSGNELQGVKFWLITLSYGRHYYKAVHKWCEETLEILKKANEFTGGKK
jgi:DNA-binding PadR family transcriptional regulator